MHSGDTAPVGDFHDERDDWALSSGRPIGLAATLRLPGAHQLIPHSCPICPSQDRMSAVPHGQIRTECGYPAQAGLELPNPRTLRPHCSYPAISGYRASWEPDLAFLTARACRPRLIDRR